jgi:hypothetical protein
MPVDLGPLLACFCIWLLGTVGVLGFFIGKTFGTPDDRGRSGALTLNMTRALFSAVLWATIMVGVWYAIE